MSIDERLPLDGLESIFDEKKLHGSERLAGERFVVAFDGGTAAGSMSFATGRR
jgi:hypothetical protein